MIKETIIFALALIVLGVASYIVTDAVSITALIPSFMGIVILICGLLATSENIKKHVMHTAVLVTLVGGVFAAIKGVPGIKAMLMGIEIARPAAAIEQGVMVVLCFIYLVMSIRWFLGNRKKKSPKMIA